MTSQTQHTIMDMDIAMANDLIDSHTSTTHIMDPAMTMHLLGLLTWDKPRLRRLVEIIKNTILYCDIILLPDEENHFSLELRTLAKSVVGKQREILAWLTKDLS